MSITSNIFILFSSQVMLLKQLLFNSINFCTKQSLLVLSHFRIVGGKEEAVVVACFEK